MGDPEAYPLSQEKDIAVEMRNVLLAAYGHEEFSRLRRDWIYDPPEVWNDNEKIVYANEYLNPANSEADLGNILPSKGKSENFQTPFRTPLSTVQRKDRKVLQSCKKTDILELSPLWHPPVKESPTSQIKQSLGISDESVNLSWTSSLATPTVQVTSSNEYNTEERKTLFPENWRKVNARVLFRNDLSSSNDSVSMNASDLERVNELDGEKSETESMTKNEPSRAEEETCRKLLPKRTFSLRIREVVDIFCSPPQSELALRRKEESELRKVSRSESEECDLEISRLPDNETNGETDLTTDSEHISFRDLVDIFQESRAPNDETLSDSVFDKGSIAKTSTPKPELLLRARSKRNKFKYPTAEKILEETPSRVLNLKESQTSEFPASRVLPEKNVRTPALVKCEVAENQKWQKNVSRNSFTSFSILLGSDVPLSPPPKKPKCELNNTMKLETEAAHKPYKPPLNVQSPKSSLLQPLAVTSFNSSDNIEPVSFNTCHDKSTRFGDEAVLEEIDFRAVVSCTDSDPDKKPLQWKNKKYVCNDIPEAANNEGTVYKSCKLKVESETYLNEDTVNSEVEVSNGDIICDENIKQTSCEAVTGFYTENCVKTTNFSTGSGKIITISDCAMGRTKKSCAEADDTAVCRREHLNAAEKTPFGFSTTSKKTGTSSESALDNGNDYMVLGNHGHPKAAHLGHIGFSTGSGKSITISDSTLEKAKTSFSEVEEMVLNSFGVAKSAQMEHVGFFSGSGKSITISDSTLQKAKRFFADSDEHSEFPETEPVGFFTGLGKSIIISDSALEKGKRLFAKDDDEPINNFGFLKSAQIGPIGFSTGSGKSVTISDSALEKGKRLFAKDDDEPINNFSFPKSAHTGPIGFSTGSGKSVTISDSALEKGKRLFAKDDDEPINNFSFPKSVQMGHIGFSTGSGKSVTISDSALEKGKRLFAQDDDEPINNFGFLKSAQMGPIGFSTGSGKSVTISDSALEKGKRLFAKDDDEPINNFSFPKSAHTGPIGFSTGSGKSVTISDSALEKGKRLFAKDDDEPINNFSFPKSAQMGHIGFSTGSGKSVTISDSALEKGKRLFAKDDDEPINNFSFPKSAHMGPIGFSTGSGKSVTISDSALEKGKRLFAKYDDEPINNFSFPKSAQTGPIGFSTGSGKSVTISDSALQKGKRLFAKDDDMAANDVEHSKSETESVGFSTGLGKSIIISDSTLERGKRLFAQDDDEPINNFSFPKSAQMGPIGFSTGSEKSITISDSGQQRPKRYFAEADDTAVSNVEYSKSPETKPFVFSTGLRKSITVSDSALEKGKRLFAENADEPMNKLRILKSAEKMPVGLCTGSEENITISDFALQRDKKLFEEENETAEICDEPLKLSDSETLFQDEVNESTAMLIADGEMCSFEEDVISGEIKAARQQLRKHQEELIEKTKGEVKAIQGRLFLAKKHERITLSAAVNGERPNFDSDAAEGILDITSTNSSEYKFQGARHFGQDVCDSNTDGFLLADEGRLILDDRNEAGWKEFSMAFLTTPGVDPGLVSEQWVKNHYRWIVWKLAAMERKFPEEFSGRSLTPEQVLLQLKYRYDREIDMNQRSCLKRVMEQDDTPAKTLVLCVSEIETIKENNPEESAGGEQLSIRLTDGWYDIAAMIDESMVDLISSGKVEMGTKLIIHGAELVGNHEPCPPLEAPSDLRLKVSTNSTRRVRWDIRLGYFSNPAPFPVPLKSIKNGGGLISRVDVVIARVYPLLYMTKDTNGKPVFQSVKSHMQMSRKREKEMEEKMERLFATVQEEFQRRDEVRRSKSKVGARLGETSTQEEYLQLFGSSQDISTLSSSMTEEQLNSLSERQALHNSQIADKIQAEVRKRLEKEEKSSKSHSREEAIPVLRVRIFDLKDESSSALLSIWRPDQDLQEMLKEGKAFHIHRLFPAPSRDRVQGLNAYRHTRYQDMSIDVSSMKSAFREVTLMSSFLEEDFQPPFEEVDVVGVVVHVGPCFQDKHQSIYLADHHQNILDVRFWGGVAKFSAQEVLRTHSFVCGLNLQYRRGTSKKLPWVYAIENSVFTLHPKGKHTRASLEILRQEVKDVVKHSAACEKKMLNLRDQLRSNMGVNAKSFSSFGEKSQSAIQKKVDLLKQYGEPPPLKPLNAPVPKKLYSKFKPPLKMKEESS